MGKGWQKFFNPEPFILKREEPSGQAGRLKNKGFKLNFNLFSKIFFLYLRIDCFCLTQARNFFVKRRVSERC